MFQARRPSNSNPTSGTVPKRKPRRTTHHPNAHAPAPKGLFQNSTWHCDCAPRQPAAHFRVKKEGRNLGRGFYTCSKSTDDKCGFFLWDEDAGVRMEAAAAAAEQADGARRTGQGETRDGNRFAVSAGPGTRVSDSAASKKRKLPWSTPGDEERHGLEDSGFVRQTRGDDASSGDEEFYDWPLSARDAEGTIDALSQAVDKAEEAAAAEAAETTPITPRKAAQTSKQAHGLPTPGTTPSKPTHRQPHPYPHSTTPTPSRVRDTSISTSASGQPHPTNLTPTILALLSTTPLAPPLQTSLTDLLTRHDRQTQGFVRGRDAARAAIKVRDARIAALEGRVEALEGEVEGLRCVGEMVADERARARAREEERVVGVRGGRRKGQG